MSSNLIKELIEISLPNLTREEKEDKEEFYFDLLNSNLGRNGNVSTGLSWDKLTGDLERIVKRQSGNSSINPTRFNSLCNKLKNQTTPHNKEVILSFLLGLGIAPSPVASASGSNSRISTITTTSSSSRNILPSRQRQEQERPTTTGTSAASTSRPSSSTTSNNLNGRQSNYNPPRNSSPPPPALPRTSPPSTLPSPLSLPLPQHQHQHQEPQSMFSLLQSHRSLVASSSSSSSSLLPPVPESLLLEDLVHILQGHQGKFIKFKAPSPPVLPSYISGIIILDREKEQENSKGLGEGEGEDGSGIEFFLEGTGYSLPATTRALIHELSELGWLLNKINRVINFNSFSFTTSSQASQLSIKGKEVGKEVGQRRVGMVEQALHAALKEEITKYLKLIADIEINRKESLRLASNNNGRSGGGGLTMRRLLVLTAEVKLIMRMMGTLVDEAGGETTGGALLTALHSRTSNGDPFIRAFSSELLKKLSVPFFATLSSWIYEGELNDPFDEFFVKLNPIVAEDEAFGHFSGGGGGGGNDDGREEGEGRVKGYELWEKKFTFRKEMLPGFLGEAFGRKIFSTGKSLNFMKCSCKESAWVSERNRDGTSRILEYADMAGLERSITLAFSVASQRLFDTFFDRYRLLDHLRALKDYVMLGKGDFTQVLMYHLSEPLSKPAANLYARDFTNSLDDAKDKSNFSADHPNTHNKLDARILQTYQPINGIRSKGGELGWEVFTLAYGVESPLDTVLDPKSLEDYSKMFKHLWSIKRVEFGLSEISRTLITSQKVFARVPALSANFHTTRIALAEMIFFIRELQYYCHLEVIACSWADLEAFALKKEGDLDSLIKAHKVYLDRLVTKALLQSSKLVTIRRNEESPEEKISMFDLLKRIFEVMLDYRTAADSLCKAALHEAARLEIPRDIARGLPVEATPERNNNSNESLNASLNRLAKHSQEFRDMAIKLVQALGTAPDLDMKFLSVRLNFNHHFGGELMLLSHRHKVTKRKSYSTGFSV